MNESINDIADNFLTSEEFANDFNHRLKSTKERFATRNETYAWPLAS